MAEGTFSQELPVQEKIVQHPIQNNETGENKERNTVLDPVESERLNDMWTTSRSIAWQSGGAPFFSGDSLVSLNLNKELLRKTIRGNDNEVVATVNILDNLFRFRYGKSYPPQGMDYSSMQNITDLMNFSAEVLGNNLGRIEQLVNGGDSFIVEASLQAVNWLAQTAYEFEGVNKMIKINTSGKALDFLLKHFDKVLSSNKKYLTLRYVYPDIPALKTIFEFGNSSQVEEGKQMAIDLLRSTDPSARQAGVRMIAGCFMSDLQQPKDIATDAISSVFSIDGKRMMDAWMTTQGNERRKLVNINKNLRFLCELEQKRPGIAKVLQSEFGINYFARYPEELLIAQYDEKDIQDDIPHGEIIYPQSDWNGVFYGNVEAFGKLFNQLGGKYRIRVWEVGDILGIVGALNKTRHKYGPISFAIVGGHGEPSKIKLGEAKIVQQQVSEFGSFARFSDKDTTINQTRHVEREGASAIRFAFTENPTIILNSCSTGQLGGIGQEISKIVGAKVIAPPKPISISNIESAIDSNGKIDFKVEYSEGSPAPQVYREGILQK